MYRARHVSKRLMGMLLLLGMGMLLHFESQGQRIFDSRFLVEQMELTSMLGENPGEDWPGTMARLDSLEKAKGYEKTQYEWLCLQTVRVLGLRETQGHEAAEALARACQESPAAGPNTFAKRAIMMFEAVEHYWGNPGLGARGTKVSMEAIELCKEKGDRQLEFDFYLFIANMYMDFRRKDLASEWMGKAKSLLSEVDDPANCHMYYIAAAEASIPAQWDSLGSPIWESEAKKAQAFAEVEKAISCGEKAFEMGHGIEVDVGSAFLIKATYMMNTPEEEGLRKKAMPYMKIRGTASEGAGFATISRMYRKQGDLKQAKLYLDSARVLIEGPDTFLPRLERFYSTCVAYYTAVGNRPDSLSKYQSLYSDVKADVMRAEQVAELEREKFQFQVTQQKLLILQQEAELEERKMRNRNLLIILTALGVILVLIFAAWLRIRQRNILIRQKNQEINAMVSELEESLAEKEILVQEVNHRVKNNLQMINSFVDIQAQYVREGETADFAESIRRRIQAVGLVHELIQETMFSKMSFEEYALQLIEELEALYFEGEAFQCESNFSQLKLDVSTNMYLGVLLNELVSNSIKHGKTEGQPLTIWVSLVETGKSLRFSYRDSGPGIPREAWSLKGKNGSIGLRLIQAMGRQLEGELTYGEESKGEVSLEFPNPEPPEN